MSYLNHPKLISQCYLVQSQNAVVISNLVVPPKDSTQFREVNFILAKQLRHLHAKLERSECFC